MYKVTVPITRHESVTLSGDIVIEIIEMEIKEICKPFDTIEHIRGEWRYITFGYGSHDIGKETGPIVDPEKVKQFEVLSETIKYLRSKQ